jgi:hypothetical protein
VQFEQQTAAEFFRHARGQARFAGADDAFDGNVLQSHRDPRI